MHRERTPWRKRAIEPVEPGDRLAMVRQCSDYAANLVDRHPEWLEQLEASGRLDNESAPHPRRADERVASRGLDDGLRAFRNQEMLRIIWRDLNGLAPLGEVLADLTTLAEVCLGKAVQAQSAALAEKFGRVVSEDGEAQDLVVLGLGKMGGRELNLSSDIDVMFCYPEQGRSDGPRALGAETYFARLSRAVIATLGEIRATGFCFRVDARLRPFGSAGPIACSFSALEQYYQREGRDWERYALIKARAVAGNIEAGEQLLNRLHPFVYRRYIDFGAIEALRDMQALVRAETRRRERHNDIKRGRGGIREIEFLAQGFQLLRGGREPTLQTPSLAEALEGIAELELLPPSLVNQLADHYCTLRHLENRIQAMRDQQTHTLPEDEDLERLAHAMGAESGQALLAQVSAVREAVAQAFDDTWAGPAGKSPAGESSAESQPEAGEWRQQWDRWRQDPSHAPPPFDGFLGRLARRPAGERAARRLDRFMPMLLQGLHARELDNAIVSRLLDLVLVITQRSAYLALLSENPGALDRTIDLFSRSAWVAQRVSRFPELLDELIDPALGQHIPPRETLEQSVRRQIEHADEESALSALNYLKQAHGLRLAVAWLEGRIDATALQASLTDLAEVMLGATLTLAERELVRKHGQITGGAVTVIGYGSLGARALTFSSDLDLVFLYRAGAEVSDGKRPLAAEHWFARLAQRMVGLLTALTPSGKLYEIDARLRPNGQSGLLVSSINAFEAYQRDSAWTWEHQALTRARAIAGEAALGEQFEGIRLACLSVPRDPAKIAEDLLEMRERIAQSHGAGGDPTAALKQAPGGLVDIGFIAQLGVLLAAPRYPDVSRHTEVQAQLAALAETGWFNTASLTLLLDQLRTLGEKRFCLELDALNRASSPGLATSDGAAIADLFRQLARAAGNSAPAV